ncbi:ABC transporter ATP-binding protein [Falsigemmobacter intermedius]|uniref:ABC transporter ATP-binding protein n=1 Tax=Falsigemmobacter intermedius TaxID=1553448 RepID=A0A3S3UW17_9RHOB|nr:ABC transporter ATP-binding protein [Falsigemmobacter intermedius]RWY37369.1 ABC transporter ATP-binding protein [Falsigemmobacter intermedius]
MTEPLLQVENLRIRFRGNRTGRDAVRGVSFSVGREKLGIVGESGSGKSQTGRALLKLTPGSATVTADRMSFRGEDLLAASEKRMRQIRGRSISMILQDPKFSLNPLMKVGDQIVEAFLVHHRTEKAAAKIKALEMLEAVHIRDPERVFGLYPHELSGGMGQRVMIAMMLIPEPDIIIADEPTSALDVTVRRQVLSVLDELVSARGTGLIFISHDLNLVASFCDRILVMYAGRVLEEIEAKNLRNARHPYTRALLQSLPRLDRETERLIVPQRDPAWLDGPVFRQEAGQ